MSVFICYKTLSSLVYVEGNLYNVSSSIFQSIYIYTCNRYLKYFYTYIMAKDKNDYVLFLHDIGQHPLNICSSDIILIEKCIDHYKTMTKMCRLAGPLVFFFILPQYMHVAMNNISRDMCIILLRIFILFTPEQNPVFWRLTKCIWHIKIGSDSVNTFLISKEIRICPTVIEICSNNLMYMRHISRIIKFNFLIA